MKKYLYILMATSIVSLMSSCGDMLDIKPVNSMMPKSLQDYESVLMGGYPKVDFFLKTENMTDNVYANQNTTYTAALSQEVWFVWAASHQLDTEVNDAYWGQLYKSIYYANSVLDELTKRTPSAEEQNQYEILVGEAYALRAFSYFYLINLYADVYSEENLSKPGVPMPISAEDVNATSKDNVRETIGNVYEQIVKDMNIAAEKLSGKSSINRFRFDFNIVQALRARVHLFMGNYSEAIKCASDVISAKSLFNMNNLQSHIDEGSDKNAFGGDYSFVDSGYNDEILFFVGGKANYNPFYYDQNMIKTSPELLALCDVEGVKDYRKYIFASFLDLEDDNSRPVGATVYRMYANQGKSTYYIGFKLSECYVTRAEAYVRMKDKENAIKDLNTLLSNRIKTEDFTPLNEQDFTEETLLKKVLDERRVETAFDGGLRWFDLRRLGKPEITHNYKTNSYTLKKNDPRYILQIPVSEQEASPNMPLNPR